MDRSVKTGARNLFRAPLAATLLGVLCSICSAQTSSGVKPINSGDVPYHTIAGARGRGASPNSSDGVVPYWSSHQKRAKSELIVPSHHGAHQTKEAIAEVERILDEQLDKSQP